MSDKRIKKIFYLIDNLNSGGAEQLLFITLKFLEKKRYVPVVYCIQEKGKIAQEIEEQLAISVHCLNRRCRLWNLRVVIDLMRIFLKERPDILHTNLFYANYFGRIAAIFTRVPVVVITEHGSYSNFKRFYHHWIDFILSLFTAKIIAVSNAVKEYLLKHTLIPGSKITVIYNAVDFEKFDNALKQEKSFMRSKLGFSESDFLLGCVATLAPWKGQFYLLEAFAEIKKFHPNLKLLYVGRDPIEFRAQLEDYARKNNLDGSVHFLGERRDVPDILRALDFFIFPSLTEGLGIALLEAMYMGLPAIASGLEGILEIVEDGKDALLSSAGDSQDLANKIRILVEDGQIKNNLGYNAREKVKSNFSPQVFIENLEVLYKL